ncbi:hypothetical protein [Streptomyces sp. ODS28]|uniref:hypothetical protein n=1 Tax=Streptomyces sp. ODS28 TaxID=3136688 RepID=UPI0031E5E0DC
MRTFHKKAALVLAGAAAASSLSLFAAGSASAAEGDLYPTQDACLKAATDEAHKLDPAPSEWNCKKDGDQWKLNRVS